MLKIRGGLQTGALIALLLGLVLCWSLEAGAGKYKRESEKHKNDCEAWCAQNAECGKCLPLLPCPPGTRKLRSWTGYGKNWHACSRPGAYQRDSKKHEEECKQWCTGNPECGKCLPLLPCPPGTRKLRSWTGTGKNWYACSRPGGYQRDSRQHEQECKQWCRNEPHCLSCAPVQPCPPGMGPLRSWRGPGKNWYACGKLPQYQRDSQRQRQACDTWCRGNTQCERCITTPPCPAGSHTYKSFTGPGQNWYACGRPATIPQGPNQRPESRRLPGTPDIRFNR